MVNPPGKLGYFPGAVGGAQPGFWDGAIWRKWGVLRRPIETDGVGIWMVGVGPCTGPAHTAEYDGKYFVSTDGYSWFLISTPIMSLGVSSSAYANGCWVVGGQSIGIIGRVISSLDPVQGVLAWDDAPPFGFTGGTNAFAADQYNNDTGKFRVPIEGAGNIEITNDQGPADPPDTGWPTQGKNGPAIVGDFSAPSVGVGTQGAVEVRIGTKADAINSQIDSNPAHSGTHFSDFLQVKKVGASLWGRVDNAVLNGDVTLITRSTGGAPYAGLSLRGLVWGQVKYAVEFAAGAN